jgi:hypothetical protein
MKPSLALLSLLLALPVSVLAAPSDEVVLSQCFDFPPFVPDSVALSLAGYRAGDPYFNGAATYPYQVRETVLVVISRPHQATFTREVVRTRLASEEFATSFTYWAGHDDDAKAEIARKVSAFQAARAPMKCR